MNKKSLGGEKVFLRLFFIHINNVRRVEHKVRRETPTDQLYAHRKIKREHRKEGRAAQGARKSAQEEQGRTQDRILEGKVHRKRVHIHGKYTGKKGTSTSGAKARTNNAGGRTGSAEEDTRINKS